MSQIYLGSLVDVYLHDTCNFFISQLISKLLVSPNPTSTGIYTSIKDFSQRRVAHTPFLVSIPFGVVTGMQLGL